MDYRQYEFGASFRLPGLYLSATFGALEPPFLQGADGVGRLVPRGRNAMVQTETHAAF